MRRCMTVLLAAMLAIAASAQEPEQKTGPAKDPNEVVLGADLVKTGLYIITGGGGNSLLRLSQSGPLLVDGKSPGAYRALMSQVRRITRLSDLPLRVLIVTDHHEDHAGNSARFTQAGVALIVQESAARYLFAKDSSDTKVPSGGKASAPTITFDRHYKLEFGGIEVHLFHFGNAHTTGDTVVYFPDLKVAAVGDLFTPQTPEPDYAGGGSLLNWGPVLAQVLKLDIERFAPSSGPLVARADLEEFKRKIDTLVSRARALVKRGVAKEQLMAELKTDDLGWHFNFTAEQLDGFYKELSQAE
jgi:cyclase